VYEKIAARVRQFIDYHLFCVMLWNEETQLLDFNYSVCFGEHIPLQGGFSLGQGLSGTAAQLKRPVRVDNVLRDKRYVRHRHPEVEIRSELVVPLLVRDRLVGVIDLESTEFGAFTREHEDLMMALARHIAIAVDNAQLYEQVSANESRMEEELATARAIQHELLLSDPPRVEGLDVGFAYASATALAGDFYDFPPLGNGRLAFAVGDVAGKSTPAALYGSLAVGIMRGEALRHGHEPARMLDVINRQLVRLGAAERFIVMAYGIVDVHSRELTYANAGFPFPYLTRADGQQRIEVPGLPLGVAANHRYDVTVIPLEPGDVLAFCSDGFADCEDETGAEFGEDQLARVLRVHARPPARLPARDMAEELLKVTDLHAGSTLRHTDDRTAVIIRLR
jgi:serine phosphatase RsbU (regulator of sigma subunit)